MKKEKMDSIVETLLENCELYQSNLKFGRALASGLSVVELKKIERRTIVEYKKGREFNALKEMWQARGEIKVLDFFFDDLTYEQRMDIIGAETSQLGAYTLSDWWKGMTKTEKTEALLTLIQDND